MKNFALPTEIWLVFMTEEHKQVHYGSNVRLYRNYRGVQQLIDGNKHTKREFTIYKLICGEWELYNAAM